MACGVSPLLAHKQAQTEELPARAEAGQTCVQAWLDLQVEDMLAVRPVLDCTPVIFISYLVAFDERRGRQYGSNPPGLLPLRAGRPASVKVD